MDNLKILRYHQTILLGPVTALLPHRERQRTAVTENIVVVNSPTRPPSMYVASLQQHSNAEAVWTTAREGLHEAPLITLLRATVIRGVFSREREETPSSL